MKSVALEGNENEPVWKEEFSVAVGTLGAISHAVH